MSEKNKNEDHVENKLVTIENLNDVAEKNTGIDNRFEFLLKQTEIFSHFVTNSIKPAKQSLQGSQKILTEFNNNDVKRTKKIAEKKIFHFESSPDYIKHGNMRDYQVRGLNWIISLYENGINGILADEMGLGKTLQSISFLGYLKNYKKICGPHLVVIPKSTLSNWMSEIANWCPSLNAISLLGDKQLRKTIKKDMLSNDDWDICVTSYEMVIKEHSHLKKYNWCYLVIDEAHRIKNEVSKLAVTLRELTTEHCLLLTGTPLQNNLHELWSLLNFMLPDVFNSSEDFDNWFNDNILSDELIIKRLHSVLRPFLLRRLKSDVEKSLKPKKELKIYVGLSQMQREWYKKILLKNIDLINTNKRIRLLNILMQLRKCTNHPYIFDGAEPGPPYTTDEHLIKNSGKMVILDKLLDKLHKKGSRVLLFSQMVTMLDILDDYMKFREYEYCRLDGKTSGEEREKQIEEFNKENSSKFVFLISTRAGGLGINLATADTVIIYDSDWNPQIDLQAMDRAHRIGQKKQVTVFRLITEKTVEERIVQRAEMKMRFDKIVQQGRLAADLSLADIKNIIQYGANEIVSSTAAEMTDEHIDQILERGELKTEEENAKLNELGENALQTWNMEEHVPYTVYQFEGEDYRKKQNNEELIPLNLGRRQRRAKTLASQNISRSKSSSPEKETPGNKSSEWKPPEEDPDYIQLRPKHIIQRDFKFYTKRRAELKEKSLLSYYKYTNYKEPLDIKLGEMAKRMQFEKQRKIDNAELFTEEDSEELEKEEALAFPNWNKNDLNQFVDAVAKYGRFDIENMSKTVTCQPYGEIERYNKVFWKRYSELRNYQPMLRKIERGEGRKKDLNFMKEILANKIAKYSKPMLQLKLQYDPNDISKEYTEKDDRFLLVTLNKLGIDKSNVYKELHNVISSKTNVISEFLKTRSPIELQQRCEYLIFLIYEENLNSAIAGNSSSDEVPAKKKKLI